MSSEINALVEVAKQAALTGGATLLDWRGRFETREKGPADFVTDADIAAQAAVREVVANAFPEHLFVGEERPHEAVPPADQICWIVDPLDGTTNYVHDFPFFATSVGVARGNELLAGAICDPSRGELFYAGKDAGAWRVDGKPGSSPQPLNVSGTADLADSLLALSLPPHVSAESPDLMDFLKLVERCRGVRRTGSAALNLAYVACGRLDANWAHQIHPWDVAAGTLLVMEAGGTVTNSDGGPFDLWKANYIATSSQKLNASMAEAMVDRR